MSAIVSLAELKSGDNGVVTSITGGFGMVRKLNALGIYEGRMILKVSTQWMRGPVVIRVGSTEMAIGYGMAGKIMVRPEMRAVA
ncbi:MAG: ferrous iron transport protein A [Chitinispirillaceae bacterium]|nr:ferrous iron transport protein A [Chitinispirillaceae bacterium]